MCNGAPTMVTRETEAAKPLSRFTAGEMVPEGVLLRLRDASRTRVDPVLLVLDTCDVPAESSPSFWLTSECAWVSFEGFWRFGTLTVSSSGSLLELLYVRFLVPDEVVDLLPLACFLMVIALCLVILHHLTQKY